MMALSGPVAGPAQAADYGGYYRGDVWRGGDCCAPHLVTYVPQVRYLRLVEQMPYCAYCDNPPTRYLADPYWSPIYAMPAEPCYSRRVPIADGRGGWTWGIKTTCY